MASSSSLVIARCGAISTTTRKENGRRRLAVACTGGIGRGKAESSSERGVTMTKQNNKLATVATATATMAATATASVLDPGCASAVTEAAATAATASESLGELARSDLWFGWYFAPGGVVLGPALILTAFFLGGALFEKITGRPPTLNSNKPPPTKKK